MSNLAIAHAALPAITPETLAKVQGLVSEGVTADLEGYNVIPCSAGRKQVFLARSPLELTAIFPLKAETFSLDPRQAIYEAEAEFTDQAEDLLSRRQENHDIITITRE